MASARCICSILRHRGILRPNSVWKDAEPGISSTTLVKHVLFKFNSVQSSRYLSTLCGLNAKSFSLCTTRTYTSTNHVKSTTQEQNPSVKDFKTLDSNEEKEREKARAASFQQKATKYALLSLAVIFVGAAGYLVAVWGKPQIDEDGNVIMDEFSNLPAWKAYLYRSWRELNYYDKMIKEPSREKLLPDPVTEPYYQPPYTLVLEMTGILVHPDWTYKTGWRFKKRPGVDFFLQHVGPPLFEIVVYTSESGFTAFPILDSLDPNGFISFKLFRDTTRYEGGHHIKDISCLNRDLSKVIIVDWNEKSVQLQPENAFKLKKWTGNDNDTSLFDLAMFLRTIVANEVDDVRTVLEFYKQFEDPLEAFKDNQRRLQEEQERLNKERIETAEKKPNLIGAWSSGFLGRRR